MLNAVKVPVSDLRVGMYVSELDRPWLDTPFIMQGFMLESRDDIETVAEYCDWVYVDNMQSKKLSADSSNVGTASSAPASLYHYETTIQEEHKRSMRTFKRARSITKSFLDEVRLGGAINTEAAKSTVDGCVQSVLRHPEALMWMSKMREENEYTSDHCLNVCVLAIAFGRSLGLDLLDLQRVGMCGLLHDVGKMRVPPHVLDKPGRLTDKEMRIMKAHSTHGRNLLLSTPDVYSGAIDVAYSHHERIDGNGYPRKLEGAAISRFSKIITIVDAYDAMTAERCYSKAITSSEALKIIYTERGKQFDEGLALVFIKMIGLYPAGSLVELYSGEVGLVIETNQSMRHLPKLVMALDENKRPVKKERLLDLSAISRGDLPKKYLIKRVWVDGSFGVYIKDYISQGLILKF